MKAKKMEEPQMVESNLETETVMKESEDRYIRLMAEFDNYKKRTSKEKEDIRMSTKISTISAVLDIHSDLSLAMKLKKDDGLSLIMAKLEFSLKSQGIEIIQTETYDSEIHEVIAVQEIGHEKIVDVVSQGYSINGKPFRYPKIVLGK
jgi:molecular chaperone GrpE